jgi:hypothetical protein
MEIVIKLMNNVMNIDKLKMKIIRIMPKSMINFVVKKSDDYEDVKVFSRYI